MNIQQEGLGNCATCGSPIMKAIGQPGIKGVCLGCQAAAQPKTGKTVVVTGETGEGSALGRVQTQEVEHNPGVASALPKDPDAVRKAIQDKANAKGITPMPTVTAVPLPPPENDGKVHLALSIEELEEGVVPALLHATYDAIDNMPPFKTLKETKKAIKVQETIEHLLKQKEK